MNEPELLVDRQGEVDVITLNRPEARNALTWRTYALLEEAVRTTTARCLVITGTDPSFCSGDDVKLVMGGGDKPPAAPSAPRLTPAADALLHTDVPVIAAVNGPAVGWGMELAVMADLRVASERARFGELFVLRGLVSDAPGLGRLAQLVVRDDAADELLPVALELAGRIAANPPLAVQRLKAGLRRAIDPDWTELGAWVSTNLSELFQTEDHREGVKAFLEKRPPSYVGR
jgi:enoyl-CoA hydratase